jgi:hypothetical protein
MPVSRLQPRLFLYGHQTGGICTANFAKIRLSTGRHIGLREAAKGGTQGLGYWKELMKMSVLMDDGKLNVDHAGETVIRFADPEQQ